MIYTQSEIPSNARAGDAWVAPDQSFKRVLSRGHSWENVNIGSKHPDEADHEQAKVEQPPVQVSGGTSAGAQGDGDNGQGATGTSDEIGQKQPEAVAGGPFEGEGVDGNGSPVV